MLLKLQSPTISSANNNNLLHFADFNRQIKRLVLDFCEISINRICRS